MSSANVDAWDAEHRRREWGRWPNEAVVRYVLSNFRDTPDRRAVRFLDLGCGAGAVSAFLRKEGFDVRAIDASEKAVARTNHRLSVEGLDGPMFGAQVASATKLSWIAPCFDCVLDVACLQCLDRQEIAQALAEAARVLKPGGKLFSYHAASDGWTGVHTVGTVYPRGAAEIAALYGQHFDCAYFHDAREQRHPHNLTVKVSVNHWIIEGIKK